jgi:hypothetical protein
MVGNPMHDFCPQMRGEPGAYATGELQAVMSLVADP